jgi:hypothetical protein
MLRPDVADVEDVEGSVSVSHSFRHEINWGHVALGVAAIYTIYQVARIYGNSTTSTDEDGSIN